jgi:hypothetical protein
MIAVLTHRTGELCLDKDFVLIEGHPAWLESVSAGLGWVHTDGGNGYLNRATADPSSRRSSG